MSQDILVDNIIFSPALPEASRPKIAGSNSLQVVSPLTRFTGALTIDSNVGIGTASAGEKLEVAGNIKIIGDSIINGQALKIMQINRPDWLCINPDEGYPGTALYKPVAINNGGLAVGELSQLAPGQLKVTSNAYLATSGGNVGIGTTQPEAKLEVSASSNHLILDRESTETTGGKVVFLELRQMDPQSKLPEVNPCIRFHHNNRWYYRIEGCSNGFHLKTGDLTKDSYAPLFTGALKVDGDVTITGLVKAASLIGNGVVPTGAVFYFATASAPAGYLECNGSAISRSAYAVLFAAIGTTYGAGDGATTFNLPDLRGEFIRGWDHGRGVDPGRAFGNVQGDAVKIPDGYGFIRRSKAGENVTSTEFDNGGAGSEPDILNPPSRESSSTTETRPRNVALLACIKC